ncbi:MAG TPA: hypothetical protein VHX42_00330 [Candidatus Babeliales bacterium]|jgi:hypothetical protein|nr:hypothetical protein [Candidatus Babeliales bacterium]
MKKIIMLSVIFFSGIIVTNASAMLVLKVKIKPITRVRYISFNSREDERKRLLKQLETNFCTLLALDSIIGYRYTKNGQQNIEKTNRNLFRIHSTLQELNKGEEDLSDTKDIKE